MPGDFPSIPNNYQPCPDLPSISGPGLGTVPHDRRVAGRLSGVWELSLRCIDPLHVGSGALTPLRRSGKAELARDLMTGRRKPILPGTSIKGAIRTLVGLLTGGDPPPRDIERAMPMPSSLFGTAAGRDTSFRGRVGFDDAAIVDPVRVRLMDLRRAFAPNAHRAVGPRIYGPAPVGAPAEVPHIVVAAGSQFVGRMTFINLDEGELGLLALALGLDGTFCPRFGGGKYHGLGRMQVTVTSSALRRGHGPIQRLDGEALAEQLAAWLDMRRVSEEVDKVLAVLRAQMGAP